MAASDTIREGDRVEHKSSRKVGTVLQDRPVGDDRILVRWDVAYNADGHANAFIKVKCLRKVGTGA